MCVGPRSAVFAPVSALGLLMPGAVWKKHGLQHPLGEAFEGFADIIPNDVPPAAYAILATNEAEKAADIKVVDYRMIGATGRVYLSGTEADVRQAATAAQDALARSAT